MARRLPIAAIVFALMVPGCLGAAGLPRSWQEGEILSRRTVVTGHNYERRQYVYRIKGFNRTYLVVSPTPLRLDLYVPMRFSVDRRYLLIQDSDGTERKVAILQKTFYRERL